MNQVYETNIDGIKITFKRLPLRKWSALEEWRIEAQDAAERKDFHGVVDAVSNYISAASNAKDIDWSKHSWFVTLEAFGEAIHINSPILKFPLLTSTYEDKHEKLAWEYKGRTWYFWVNLLGTKYGWLMDVIGKLDIDDAIGLYQEILIDDQMQREWEYGITELAYPYNKTTKQCEFKPLTRPMWMRGITPKPKKIKILKSLLPVGNVVGLDNDKRTKNT